MLEAALSGQANDLALQDMERMMDGMMEEAMQEMQSLRDQAPRGSELRENRFWRGSRTFSSAWSESSQGRTLKVLPADKNAKLDVEVKQGLIILKSEVTQSNGRSLAQQTFSVPQDCDGDQVKMEAKDGALSLFFPFRGRTQPERRPLKGNPGDIQT